MFVVTFDVCTVQIGCYPVYDVDSQSLILLGVRSLANASRARQFNPLNPPGVGWVPLPQTNMAAVVGRARSCAVITIGFAPDESVCLSQDSFKWLVQDVFVVTFDVCTVQIGCYPVYDVDSQSLILLYI